jgi:hypothetical protein
MEAPKNVTAFCELTYIAGLPDGLFSNQKSKILENLGGPLNGQCRYILSPFGIFYGNLVQCIGVWYSFWPCGISFPFW